MAVTPTSTAAPIPGAQPNAGGAAPAPAANAAAGNTQNITGNSSSQLLAQTLDKPLVVSGTSFGDNTKGLANAISDLSKLSMERQKRLKDIYLAIGADAQATGQYNQYALTRAQRETALEEQSSSLMRSVFDKLNNAIQAWTAR